MQFIRDFENFKIDKNLGKGTDTSGLFGSLAIAKSKSYEKHFNNHNMIFIDFSRIPENCDSYQNYIARISDSLRKDVVRTYSSLNLDENKSIWDILLDVFQETGDKFIFMLDEWDAVFHMLFVFKKQQKEYLLFLKNLLKD